MTLPKGLNGKELVNLLQKLGYEVTRQVGSHIRLTTQREGTHHITVPNHRPIKIGTLSAILKDVGNHFGKTKDEIWGLIK